MKNGYRVDFNMNNSFGELLGFEKIIVGSSTNVENTTESSKVVEITLIKKFQLNVTY